MAVIAWSRSSPGKLPWIGLVYILWVLVLSTDDVKGAPQLQSTERFKTDLIVQKTTKFPTNMTSGDLNDQRKQKLQQDFLSQLRPILQQELTGFEDLKVTAITIEDKFVIIAWYMTIDPDDAAFDQMDTTKIKKILAQDFEDVKQRFGNIRLDTTPGDEDDNDSDEWIVPVAISLGLLGLSGVIVLIVLVVLILHKMRQRSGAVPRRFSQSWSSSADSQASTHGGEDNYTYVVDFAGEKSPRANSMPKSPPQQ